MKKLIFIFFFGAFFFMGSAQIQVTSPWVTTGNTGTLDYHFLGTRL